MKLRVWYIMNPPNSLSYEHVHSIDMAIEVIERETRKQLFDTRILSNAFGLEEYDDELGWTEYYDEGGNDIDAIIAKEKA